MFVSFDMLGCPLTDSSSGATRSQVCDFKQVIAKLATDRFEPFEEVFCCGLEFTHYDCRAL
jgi:hypothetical protein